MTKYLWKIKYHLEVTDPVWVTYPGSGDHEQEFSCRIKEQKRHDEVEELFAHDCKYYEPLRKAFAPVTQIRAMRIYICPQCKQKLYTINDYQLHNCEDNPEWVKWLKRDADQWARANRQRAINEQERLY